MRSPKALDHSLPEAYQKVMQLEGVQGVHETHFWTLCSNYYCGGLKLEVSANADAKYIVSSQYLGTGDNLLFQNSGHSHHQNNFTGYGNSYGGKHSDHSGHGHSHHHGQSGHGHGHSH